MHRQSRSYPVTHAEAIRHRTHAVMVIQDTKCQGQLQQRLFHGPRQVYCTKCGTQLWLNPLGQVYMVFETKREGVIEVGATEHGPRS